MNVKTNLNQKCVIIDLEPKRLNLWTETQSSSQQIKCLFDSDVVDGRTFLNVELVPTLDLPLQTLITRATFCCSKKIKKLHLFLKKVAKVAFILKKVAKLHKTNKKNSEINTEKVCVYSALVLLTYKAKYFHTLSWANLRSLAKSLPSMLKLLSTLHEVAWHCNSLA